MTKQTPNILVFDLDGTIVFDGKAIEASLLGSLRQLQEKYRLIFASARPIRDMLPLLGDFEKSDLIGANGSMYRQNQLIHLKDYLTQKSSEKIIQLIDTYDLDYIVDYDWDYSARIRDKDNHILEKLDPDSIASQVPLSQKQVTKIILFGVTPDLAKLFQELTEATVLYHDLVEELVITAKGIDKYNAIKALIGDESYIAFGNDHNDITMLENAQKAICLGNLLQSTNYHSMDIAELRRYLEELVSIK
ncbi:HAD-IIB family hydrolase [Streptococcus uberis]|uniref:HAD-IIB family hydrolase n=1 Tax=Streptococcus uberis TaxID=1349 RepID=UPI0022B8EE70|nr:HAD-IIB family hydrolase [Streptococcus uberis]MCZ8466915.1 HAD-IIB family hydrolase [Streptococcus uberis]